MTHEQTTPPGFRRLAEMEEGFDVSAGGPPFRELLPPVGDRPTSDNASEAERRRYDFLAADGGMDVSAGPRITRPRPSADRLTIDLSGVPAEKRAGVEASLREIVIHAGGAVLQSQQV